MSKKSVPMRIAVAGCPSCGGDLYLDYKLSRYGPTWRLEKCLSCGRVYPRGTADNLGKPYLKST